MRNVPCVIRMCHVPRTIICASVSIFSCSAVLFASVFISASVKDTPKSATSRSSNPEFRGQARRKFSARNGEGQLDIKYGEEWIRGSQQCTTSLCTTLRTCERPAAAAALGHCFPLPHGQLRQPYHHVLYQGIEKRESVFLPPAWGGFARGSMAAVGSR